ncbi:MAG TPA: hypothetical protein PK530_23495, partial [Anaerolineales bacterium]|nr:hypothetical protein [Anaerolineales bacterium]
MDSNNRSTIFVIIGLIAILCVCLVGLGIAGVAFFRISGSQISSFATVEVVTEVVVTLPALPTTPQT